MSAGTYYLPTIYYTSKEEIDNDLYPQCLVFWTNVVKSGSHRVHSYETANAKGTREEVGCGLPEVGYAALWPRYSSKEEERQRGEYHNEHDVLAITHRTRNEHSEEDTCQQVRYYKSDEV